MSKQRDYTVKLKSFPDLGGVFTQFKIWDKLREIPDTTLLGCHIRLSIESGKPLGEILNEIMEYYAADQEAVLGVIHQDTINMIKQLLYKKDPDDLKGVRFGL